jgi:hypothetical protein
MRTAGGFTVYGLGGWWSTRCGGGLPGWLAAREHGDPAAGGGSALRKQVRFKITAKTGRTPAGAATPANSYKVKVTTRPDQLRGISVSGELTGPGVTAYFNNVVLVFFVARYPTTRWVPTIDFDSNARTTAPPTSSSLPGAGGAAAG